MKIRVNATGKISMSSHNPIMHVSLFEIIAISEQHFKQALKNVVFAS